jgi:hypothetical protein
MYGRLGAGLWEDRWRIAAWILPSLLLFAVLRWSLLPMAERLRDARAQVVSLRQNRYEPAWLDSTRAALRRDVEALSAFKRAREASLNADSGMQATVDRIRALAQAAGIEVVKTTPVLGRADSLRLLRVRIEGLAGYPALLRFFADMRDRHADLFAEELSLRQGGERSQGRLAATVTICVYSRRKDRGT